MKIFKIRASKASVIYATPKSKRPYELSEGAKTYVEEFYAGHEEEIWSKYIAKGNAVEEDNIELASKVLNLGELFKNKERKEDDYFTGECDISSSKIVEIKSVWSPKTLYERAIEPDYDHILQVHVYMELWNKKKAVIFYGLQDTPEELGFVDYSYIPEDKRWVAWEIDYNSFIIQKLKNKVELCRDYMKKFESSLLLGRINKLKEKNEHLHPDSPFTA